MANFHVISGAGDKLDMPVIHTITLGDLGDALRRGIADFWEKPSHYVMLVLIYPIVGIVLTVWMNGYHTWPLLYPLVGGFALLGPFAPFASSRETSSVGARTPKAEGHCG